MRTSNSMSTILLLGAILATGCQDQPANDQSLLYSLDPSISLAEGSLTVTPGLSWNNQSSNDYIMNAEALVSTDNGEYSSVIISESAIQANSTGTDKSHAGFESASETASAYIFYTLSRGESTVSREWRKVTFSISAQTMAQPANSGDALSGAPD